MTDEIAVYQTDPPDVLHRQVTDDWFDAFANIIRLAEYVADTAFVPDTMRRQPGAIAAAILTGREMGIPPMAALRLIHIIKGRPGQAAELMRALILRAGHELRDVEVTDTRVILEGRRRGETEWGRASFTADDARKARIALGDYPKDKLYARATSRLARRKFADVIAGLPTTDELEDAAAGADVVELAAVTDQPTGPAVQRKRATRKPRAAGTQPKQADAGEPERKSGERTTGNAPPPPASADEIAELLGDATDDAHRAQVRADVAPLIADAYARAGVADAAVTAAAEAPEPDEPATKPQNRKMHALFREAGLTERDDRLEVTGAILGYRLETSASLTKSEANRLIDTLETWQTAGEADDNIRDILNEATMRDANTESEPDP